MENLGQDSESVPHKQTTFDLLGDVIKEEPSDFDNRTCQTVDGVISDKDIKPENVDLAHDGSTSMCLAVWKSEKSKEYETNFISENDIDRKDIMVSEVTDVKKEYSESLVVSDGSSGDSHYFNDDEKVELLIRRSDDLTKKLRAVCKEEEETEMGESQMTSSDTIHTNHSCHRANRQSEGVKAEPDSGNEKSEIFSGDMICHIQVNRGTQTGQKNYKCDICGVGFSRRGLQDHKRIHGEKPYKCDVCRVGFAGKKALQVHKITHTGEKPFKCDVCGVGFSTKKGVQDHKRIHTGDKPYKCDICGVGFARTGHLQVHIRIHTGEKPYKCDVCDAGFAHAGHLQVHKRIHTGEKPHKCKVCGAGFARISHLQVHKKIHTGEKPYRCDVCGGGFSRKDHLQRHRRIHTGETL